MRILQLHCDSIGYIPTGREIQDAEEIDDTSEVQYRDIVAAFVSVEDGDDSSVVRSAMSQLRASMEKIGCRRLLLYPYAHLSPNLAKPQEAFRILQKMEADSEGIQIFRSPFGWTKSYKVSVKGHPLAESFRIITKDSARKAEAEMSKALHSEGSMRSYWKIMSPDGTMVDVADFDFSKHKNLEALARYEYKKQRRTDSPPPHVALMKKLAIADYESASDSGNMRFFPNGRLVKSLIERYVTDCVREYGGCEVETPIMYDTEHPSMVSYFNRFPARQYSIDSEGKHLFLRFAACFGQFLMANQFQMSYRNLPYKLYELTRYSFRREQSGELVGLRRLRAFTMPDCHAFCRDMPQAVGEIQKRFDLSRNVLKNLGIGESDYHMAIRFTESFYEENRRMVEDLVRRHGRPVLVEMWKERFFYFVLKWEFNFVDESGKASALSTDQIDVENGRRYSIEFVDEDGAIKNPIILHNSPSGAVERIIYALLEKAASDSKRGIKPQLPLWLSPTQVRIIPLKDDLEFCESAVRTLADRGVRVDMDDRNESIGRRIRDAEKEWIRYIVVIGPREAELERLSVRDRADGSVREMSVSELLDEIAGQVGGKPHARLNLPMRLSQRPVLMV